MDVHMRHGVPARAWWAESRGLPGLVSDNPPLDRLIGRVTALIANVWGANSILPSTVFLSSELSSGS